MCHPRVYVTVQALLRGSFTQIRKLAEEAASFLTKHQAQNLPLISSSKRLKSQSFALNTTEFRLFQITHMTHNHN